MHAGWESGELVLLNSADGMPGADPKVTLLSVALLALTNLNAATAAQADVWDVLIIGAGSAGIQAGLMCEQHGLNYTILERTATAASFWRTHPRFDELISLNKYHPDERQQMRYDWHSLLGTNRSLRDVTDRYFPRRHEVRQYYTGLAEGLRIEYNKTALSLTRGPCVAVELESGPRCARRILVGTGLRFRHDASLEAMGAIPYTHAKREMARRRNVCLFGNGNSAMELSQNIFDIALKTVTLGKHPVRVSAITRYTGDVRIKYLQVLENFNFKALDTVLSWHDGGYSMCALRLANGSGLLPKHRANQVCNVYLMNFLRAEYGCDMFFYATGFQSVVPGGLSSGQRFPRMGRWWSHADVPGVHYIGWLMHAFDFRAGSSGFVSGFRYLVRQLFRHILLEDRGVSFEQVKGRGLAPDEVKEHVLRRVQFADDLVNLQGGQVVRDVIAPSPGKAPGSSWSYFEAVPYKFVNFPKGSIHLYFSWGNATDGTDVFEGKVRRQDSSLYNRFLHPVIERFGRVREIQEDVDVEWNDAWQEDEVYSAVDQALRNDTTNWHPSNTWVPYDKMPRELKTAAEKPPAFDTTKGPRFIQYISERLMDSIVKQDWQAIFDECVARDECSPELYQPSFPELPKFTDGAVMANFMPELPVPSMTSTDGNFCPGNNGGAPFGADNKECSLA